VPLQRLQARTTAVAGDTDADAANAGAPPDADERATGDAEVRGAAGTTPVEGDTGPVDGGGAEEIDSCAICMDDVPLSACVDLGDEHPHTTSRICTKCCFQMLSRAHDRDWCTCPLCRQPVLHIGSRTQSLPFVPVHRRALRHRRDRLGAAVHLRSSTTRGEARTAEMHCHECRGPFDATAPILECSWCDGTAINRCHVQCAGVHWVPPGFFKCRECSGQANYAECGVLVDTVTAADAYERRVTAGTFMCTHCNQEMPLTARVHYGLGHAHDGYRLCFHCALLQLEAHDGCAICSNDVIGVYSAFHAGECWPVDLRATRVRRRTQAQAWRALDGEEDRAQQRVRPPAPNERLRRMADEANRRRYHTLRTVATPEDEDELPTEEELQSMTDAELMQGAELARERDNEAHARAYIAHMQVHPGFPRARAVVAPGETAATIAAAATNERRRMYEAWTGEPYPTAQQQDRHFWSTFLRRVRSQTNGGQVRRRPGPTHNVARRNRSVLRGQTTELPLRDFQGFLRVTSDDGSIGDDSLMALQADLLAEEAERRRQRGTSIVDDDCARYWTCGLCAAELYFGECMKQTRRGRDPLIRGKYCCDNGQSFPPPVRTSVTQAVRRTNAAVDLAEAEAEAWFDAALLTTPTRLSPSSLFRTFSRVLNSLFCLACQKVTRRQMPSRGFPAYVVNTRITHLVGPLMPSDQNPRFAQMYVFDAMDAGRDPPMRASSHITSLRTYLCSARTQRIGNPTIEALEAMVRELTAILRNVRITVRC
jgi:hypothetical protein